MFSGKATRTNFIVFDLTRPGLEPTIYRTRGEHANHYTSDAVHTYINIISCEYTKFCDIITVYLNCDFNSFSHLQETQNLFLVWEFSTYIKWYKYGLMVFKATFNSISVISWRSFLLVEETGGPGENHWPVASHGQTLSHNVVHHALIGIRIHTVDRHWLHR